MTRKDFELIAEVLSGHYQNGNEEQKAEIAACALTFAQRLQSTNPRFNIQRFVSACTIQSPKILDK